MSQNHSAGQWAQRNASEADVGPALIDAHCHLEQGYYTDAAGVADVIARSRAAGVSPLVAVGASGILRGAHEALGLVGQHEDVFAALGIHPCEVHDASDAHMQELASLLLHPKAVALGEVGLDYYRDASTKPVQKARFKEFVAMAKVARVPLMLHIRDAHEDCLALLDEVGVPQEGAMIHCFTAGPDIAEAYLRRGLHLSIPGVVTFKNAKALQAAVPLIPNDRLLLETDSPYLTPVPHRGKTNEPAFVRHTAQAVAELRGQSLHEVAQASSANARALFGLPTS